MRTPSPKRLAFTLIELLIVVAIIAILAAIAVPNFLEAQTRSKVSRVKADMRSVATGIESYAVDNNKFPPGELGSKYFGNGQLRKTVELTTPVAYLTSVEILDPFQPDKRLDGSKIYPPPTLYYQCFAPYGGWWRNQVSFNPELANANISAWYLESWGPDKQQNFLDWFILADFVAPASQRTIDEIYDPTNGTVSYGDIGRLGGSAPADKIGYLSR